LSNVSYGSWLRDNALTQPATVHDPVNVVGDGRPEQFFLLDEDETGIANLVVWPSLYERQRRIILGAGMIAVQGRVQREGEVVHLVAQHMTDLSKELAEVGERDDSFPLPHGRGDEFYHGSPRIDPRSLPPKGPKPRDIYIPDLHIDSIKVKTRDFR
jgi:error-prone DNA polymerase